MEQHILRSNALTDNTLKIADKGKVFKGGYKAIIFEYSFQSSWSDKQNITRFRTLDTMKKYIDKNYQQSEIENIIINQ